MNSPAISIRRARHEPSEAEALADVLMDCVEGGASIGFMLPLARAKAVAFWQAWRQASRPAEPFTPCRTRWTRRDPFRAAGRQPSTSGADAQRHIGTATEPERFGRPHGRSRQSIWTAVAERSGDTAFARAESSRTEWRSHPLESAVAAIALPAQSI